MRGLGIIIKKNGKYLMIQQSKEPYKGYWGVVHGSVELTDKTEKNAVKREVKEELGIKVNVLKKITTTYIDKIETSWWLTEYKEGTIKIDISEISKCREVTLAGIFKLNLFPSTKEIFQKYKDYL